MNCKFNRFDMMRQFLGERKKMSGSGDPTRPYLFFSPDPKLFFHFLNTKQFGPNFYSIFKKFPKNFLKRSCKHYKKMDNFKFSFETLICCLDWEKVNFENRNTLCVSLLFIIYYTYLILKHWIFNLFFVCKQMCALECWLFSGTELLAITKWTIKPRTIWFRDWSSTPVNMHWLGQPR